MKSQVCLLTAMLRDAAEAVGFNSKRDELTLRSRTEFEGEAFLSVTLPHLDDLLTEGIDGGLLPSHEGWKSKKGTVLPAFLYGLWARIFSPTGVLLVDPDINSIRYLRQISRTYKKVFEVCAEDRVSRAIEAYVATDLKLGMLKIPSWVDALRDVMHYAFGGVVGSCFSEDVLFKNGPGAVAERLHTHAKYDFSVVSRPAMDLVGIHQFVPSHWHAQYEPPVEGEVPARLVAVPKTATKPRLISIEPSYNQYLQQGFHTVLKHQLGRIPLCGYLDRTPNQRLARAGSIDGSLTTVDLSEASDRVHMGLLRHIFSWNRAFVHVLESTRSRMVELPDGRLVLLNKFASMGSALTFPVETMVFAGLLILSICTDERNFSRAFVRSQLTRGDLRVFGDDIIMPSQYYPTLRRLLEEAGMVVNHSKTFSNGLFRESCGGDYYGGHDVTPVYVRRRHPSEVRQVDRLVSLTKFRNQMWLKYGSCHVVAYCDELISSILTLPTVPAVFTDGGVSDPEFDGLYLLGDSFVGSTRWNSSLQRLEFRAPVASYHRKQVKSSGKALLMESLVTPFNEDPDHLDFDGRPVSAKLKHRWVAAH